MAAIIGIFGFLFIIFKIALDKGASQSASQKAARKKSEYEQWCDSITDKDLEMELELYIYENPVEAEEKTIRLYPWIPKDQLNPKTCLRVLLSEHGKLMESDVSWGINNPSYVGPRLIQMRKTHEFYKFMVWLNDNLKRHGADTGEMFFERGASYERWNMQKTEEEKFYSGSGKYKWAPLQSSNK